MFSCENGNEYGVNRLINDNYEDAEKEYFKYYFRKNKTNMSKISVRGFVNKLKANTKDNDKLDLLVTIGQTDNSWISDNDLEFLVSKINSKVKAKCINRLISSLIPDSKNMTLGNQIISIIESYRNNETYPNEICVCKTYDQNKVKEILAWWKHKNGS